MLLNFAKTRLVELALLCVDYFVMIEWQWSKCSDTQK